MTGRSVPEWVGKTPDTKVPARVRQRVYEAYNRTCHLSCIKIADGMAWELEHVKPLHMGGEHRESNLAPALTEHHKIKSAAERKLKAKSDRGAQKASGSRPKPKKPIVSAPFPQSGRRQSHPIGMPPRRSLFEERR